MNFSFPRARSSRALHRLFPVLTLTIVALLLVIVSPNAARQLEAQSFEVAPINWVSGPNMPTDRVIPGVSASRGKIVVTGGFNGTGPGGGSGNTLNVVEAFDIASGAWQSLAGLPTSTKGHGQVTTPDGRVWVVGGQLGDTDLTTVQVYNPDSNSWDTKRPMQVGRYRHALALGANGKIYAIGGGDIFRGRQPLSSVEEYDPATDTWRSVADLPQARSMLGAAGAPNGKIYAVGGYLKRADGALTPSRDVLEYDPVANTWTKKTEMLNTSTGFGIAVAPNGKIWMTGGNTMSGNVEVYDPSTNQWQTATDMPQGMRNDGGAAFGSDGRLYAVGGVNQQAILNTMEIGTIVENTPTATITPTPSRTPTVTPTYTATPRGTPAKHVFLPLIVRGTQIGGW